MENMFQMSSKIIPNYSMIKNPMHKSSRTFSSKQVLL